MIRSFVYGVLNTNAYLVWQDADAVLVDPPDDTAEVEKVMAENGLTLKALLCTHLHFDHVTGCAAWQKKTGLPVLAGQQDIDNRKVLCDGAKNFDLTISDFTVQTLQPGMVSFGALNVTVISVPGHTRDHSVIISRPRKFFFPETRSFTIRSASLISCPCSPMRPCVLPYLTGSSRCRMTRRCTPGTGNPPP